MNLSRSIYSNVSSINLNYVAGLERFKKCNKLNMCVGVINALLEIPEVSVITNKWLLSINTEIDNMLKMVHRSNISVNLVNEIPIREDGSNKIDQT